MSEREEVAWSLPTSDEVKATLAALSDPQHRRLFFEGLNNPEWVDALDREGAFATPPQCFVDDAGYLQADPWPEGAFLIRMGKSKSQSVASVFVRVQDTTNPYVQRQIVSACVQLDFEDAALLIDAVCTYLDGDFRRLIDPTDIPKIIASLVAGVKHKEALRLATKAYRPEPSEYDQGACGQHRVTTGVEEFWFTESFASVSRSLWPVGAKWLAALRIWLERYQDLTRSIELHNESIESDFSCVWRSSIESGGGDNGRHDVADALIDALRDFALDAIEQAAEAAVVVDPLLTSNTLLVRRVGLYVLAHALVSNPKSSAAIATNILLDPAMLTPAVRNEYALVASRALPLAGSTETEAWLENVLQGHHLSDDELTRNQRWRFADNPPSISELAELRRERQWADLASIDQAALPASARSFAVPLIEEFGEWIPPSPRAREFAIWGAKAPDELDDIAAMTAGEVIAFLRTWSPSGGLSSETPTIEGASQALRQDVAARPAAYADLAPEISSLESRYVAAYLTSLRETATDGPSFAWEPVLRFGRGLASITEPTATPAGRAGLHLNLQRELLSLIQAGLAPNTSAPIPTSSWRIVLEILNLLAESPEPAQKEPARPGGEMGPLTASLNAVRPAALRLAARLVRNAGAVTEAHDNEIATGALAILDRHLGAENDASIAVAAAYGEAIGSLASFHPDWARERMPRLLGDIDSEYSQVVISTTLIAYQPSKFLFDLLTPWLPTWIDLLTSGSPVRLGHEFDRSAMETIGDHLILLVARGVISADDPLVTRFLTRSNPESTASVLGHLGWLLIGSDAPQEFLSRCMSIWDARRAAVAAGNASSAELAKFNPWVRCRKFPSYWWLPRLLEASRATDFDTRGLIGEQLADAAAQNAGLALEVLSSLLSVKDQPYDSHDLLANTPRIIALALDGIDPGVNARARDLLDELARRGHFALLEQVANLRQ